MSGGQDPEQVPDQVLVVGPDGRPVGTVRLPAGPADAEGSADAPREPEDPVEQPAKVMRIGTMTKQLLEEVRATELDPASRRRLRAVHDSSLRELSDALAPELREELARLVEPFDAAAGDGGPSDSGPGDSGPSDGGPSDGELRVAQAQLVGWLEGLFHGIQTTLVAQQMVAKMQLEQMRRGLPAGSAGGAEPTSSAEGTTGQYL